MSRIVRMKPAVIAAAVLGLALCLPGLIRGDQVILHGYLIGLLFWTGLSLGSLALLMVNHTAGGRWGLVIRRPLESAAATLPLCAVLFLPILFGVGHLYEWAHAPDEHVQRISAYLNVPFFMIRFVAYFAIWIGMTTLLRRASLRQDGGADVGSRLRAVSAPGLVIIVLTTTFAFTDWMMSLEPHWMSTIYGSMVLVGHATGALAAMILVASLLREAPGVMPLANPARFHQLGNLLFAFVMLWAYFSFSQYLLIWSANLSEEVPWVLRRTTGGWQYVAIVLVIFHFVAPFFILLSRQLKRSATALGGVAGVFLLARWLDLLWLVGPALRADGFSIHWSDIASTIGVGGAWLICFSSILASRPLAPVGDPRFKEASA